MNSPRPRMGRVHYRLARFLKALGCARLAARAYRDALARAPSWAEAQFEMGEVLLSARDWSGAVPAFAEAVRLQPDNYESWGHLALAHAKTGRTREAIAALESLARLRSHDVDIHLLLGALYRRAQRQEDAVRAFRWAVRLPSPPAGLRCHLGEEMLGLDGWRSVRAAYADAAAVKPSVASGASPVGHSCLNQHPDHAPREFRRIVPRAGESRPTSLLRRPLPLPEWRRVPAIVRSALDRPAALWRLAAAIPRVLLGRSRGPVSQFPARPSPVPSRRDRWTARDLGSRRSAS